MSQSSPWHLVYCKARNEQRALTHLANQNVVSFFPLFSYEKIVRGKRTILTEPVFPNYLFVEKKSHVSYTTIRSTRGISDFVRMGNQPVQVPKELVFELMALSDTPELNQFASEKVCHLPLCGDKVAITEGPYQGLEAIYQKADGLERSMLLITLIQKEPIAVSFANKAFQF
ncbi:transcription/translation regulatory transformer protein RfaH [Celerinatantimonas yamalensis]|uniref:Transcription/translation regulatory transformer protein RfaH n=1 Tax=Celerinatantimonas yamalensis TaxID=559956 RepID=A0ABW9G6Y1_9GAMM